MCLCAKRTGTLLLPTCRETGSLDGGDRRCPSWRYCSQALHRDLFLVGPTHSSCLFCKTLPKFSFKSQSESVIEPPCVSFTQLFFIYHQESSKPPKPCLPKWSTLQTSKRKWRKNFLNSCDPPPPFILCLYLIFKKNCLAHKLLHICFWIM